MKRWSRREEKINMCSRVEENKEREEKKGTGKEDNNSGKQCFILTVLPFSLILEIGLIYFSFMHICVQICLLTSVFQRLLSLRSKDRCGSQPASLNQVQERRRPLKAHQSESYLPLGKGK